VRITRVGSQIRGHCPVHRIITGHDDANPSWGINATTGAWLCFSCHATGSLPRLVDMLGGDVDGINQLILHGTGERLSALVRPAEDTDAPAEPEQPYVSPYGFSKNPYPPARMREARDVDIDTCVAMNIRWDIAGRCWLLPIYAFQGALLGWQEKSTGYVNTVPKGVMKRNSLFGYQSLTGTERVIVVESPLDAARLYHYGYEAVAIFGSYVSDEQIAAIANVDLRNRGEVVLAFDNDASGHRAAFFTAPKLRDLGVDVRFFNYDTKSEVDPGEVSPAALHRGVRTATRTMPRAIDRAGKR
jgi:hypothetical protein